MVHDLQVGVTLSIPNDRFDEYLLDKDVVRGLPFVLTFEFYNTNDEPFPGGEVDEVELLFVETISKETFSLNPIEPGENLTHEKQFDAVEEGRIGLKMNIRADDGERVKLFHPDGENVGGDFIETFYCVNRERLMILSALDSSTADLFS